MHADLFDLQPVAPDPLQQVTETRYQGVLLHAGDADLAVTQLHSLPTHLLHQHAFGLQGNKHINTLQINTLTYWILFFRFGEPYYNNNLSDTGDTGKQYKDNTCNGGEKLDA